MTSLRTGSLATILASVILLAATSGIVAQDAQSQKYAVLIGVTRYGHAAMNGGDPLKYPEDDAKAVGQLLTANGYEVDLLLGSNATYSAIQQKLDGLIRKGNSEGVAFVGFFGHGVQAEIRDNITGGKSVVGCFCPYDTELQYAVDADGKQLFDEQGKKLTEPSPKSLVKMSEVAEALANAKAQTRFMIADCCRNLPNRARGRNLGFGANFSTDKLPTQTVMLFGCKPGEQSLEMDELQHGVFTKALLDEIPSMLELGPVTTGTLADRVKLRVQSITKGKQNPVPISLDSIDLKLTPNSLSGRKLALIPVGQQLSEAEKAVRRSKITKLLASFQSSESTGIKEALSNESTTELKPCFVYIHGRMNGPASMKFRLEDVQKDTVPYIAELFAIDRKVHDDLYKSKAEQLVKFLADRRYEVKGMGILDQGIRGGSETVQTWRIYFSPPKASSLLSAFHQDTYRAIPGLIRPTLAVSSLNQRREELPTLTDSTDRAVVASLCGDYQTAEMLTKSGSQGTSAVIAPALLGDVDSALRIAASLDPLMRNAALVMIVNSLLDEGKVVEVKQILPRIDWTEGALSCVGDIPLPIHGFFHWGTTGSSESLAFVAGRLHDEKLFAQIQSSLTRPGAEDDTTEYQQFTLKVSFAMGLAADLLNGSRLHVSTHLAPPQNAEIAIRSMHWH